MKDVRAGSPSARRGASVVALVLALCACGSGGGGGAGGGAADTATPTPALTATPTPTPTAEPADARVARTYPDLAAIYGAAHGIYRSCGPNFGVCHNSRQYPNLRSLESIADAVGRPCNRLRDDPLQVHDWCEGEGDYLRVGERSIEIANLTRLDEDGAAWRIRLRDSPPDVGGQTIDLVRRVGDESHVLFPGLEGAVLDVIGAGQGGPAIEIDSSGVPSGTAVAEAFARAGIPGDPTALRLGDPNRNGTFGADLGNALILPAHPERSYLMMRLTNPDFGTLMPLANCCFWTKDALRALWCWIAGLDEDGGNVFASIDYATCPDGPRDEALYPEPGDGCEARGLCPVQPSRTPIPGQGFSPVFAIVLSNCAGTACHVGGNAAGFSIPDDEGGAYDAVLGRVVPTSPEASLFYARLDRDFCDLPECIPMPFGLPPLSEQDLDTIRRWIGSGAQR